MATRIALITDIHYSRTPSALANRKSQRGAALLRRTVDRLNNDIKPDGVAVLGDLIDDPEAPEAEGLLLELRQILERLACTWLAIPGNHDPNVRKFFGIFERHNRLDLNDVRLVPFVDPERPGYNAERDPNGLRRMAQQVEGHAGPRIALQHVPVGEPRRETPYGYTNHEAVFEAMRRSRYSLAVSGHFHRGRPLREADGGGFSTMVVPALCESPFTFALVNVDGEHITSELFHYGDDKDP
ncbi:MAG: hypothetical protein GC164_03955 [Phycisphaera sp.]|nr:hypothetical protein [Phycisphaera sp.]